MTKKNKVEQIKVIILVSTILLILGFGNVITFINYLSQTYGFEFIYDLIPEKYLYMIIFLGLIYVLYEHPKIAEKIVGKL